jgi:signal transduction histidine kinase
MPDRRLTVGASVRSLVGNRPVLVLLAFSAGLLILAITAAFLAMGSLARSNELVEQTLRVEATINRIIGLNERIETSRRGYLIAPDDSFVRILQRAQSDIKFEVDQAERLLSDNSRQMDRLDEIKTLEARRGEIVADTILTPMTIAAQAREAGLATEPGVVIARRIRALGNLMVESEQNLLFAANRQQIASQQRFYLLGGLATLLLVVSLVAVILLVLRYNRELSAAQAGLRGANEGLEDAVSQRTAELTRANAEIQRFAYIVSHDLRSPLVNVLGFTAELDQSRKTIHAFLAKLFEKHPALRDESTWLAVEEDLPEALDFIRKSTEKMDRLINSILELSRQGRRQLAPERLDMNVLVDGVVSSLHQRAQDAGAEVVVEPVPELTSDRIALEQILSNLIENALKYLAPGRPGKVTVSGSRKGPLIEIAVRDNGRGIDPVDHERVFDLFRRAGMQDQPGEGIGLANVRALAYRLGGNVAVESQLDEGAVFTLSLPERFSALDTAA